MTDYVTHNVTVNNGGGNACEGVTYVNYEGQTYHTVEIGNQCWFKENLNVGTRTDGSQNMSNNGAIEKYCYHDNEANCNTYGGLYQWDEMMQYTKTQGTKGICPAGWHLPTDDEWTTLTDFLGGTGVAGGKMKSTSGWVSNGNGTNSSGFSALPGGCRYSNGYFYALTSSAYVWSSGEYSSGGAWYRRLHYGSDEVRLGSYYKSYGFSVRCLKD